MNNFQKHSPEYERLLEEDIRPSEDYKLGYSLGLGATHVVVPGSSNAVYYDIIAVAVEYGYERGNTDRPKFIVGYSEGWLRAKRELNLTHSFEQWQSSFVEHCYRIKSASPDTDFISLFKEELAKAPKYLQDDIVLRKIENIVIDADQPLLGPLSKFHRLTADIYELLKTQAYHQPSLEHSFYLSAACGKAAYKAVLDKEYSANKGATNEKN